MDRFFTTLSESTNKILKHVPTLSLSNAIVACIAVWASFKLIRMSRRRVHTTRLQGPPSPSFIFGAVKLIFKAEDPDSIYESWAKEYGAVYEMPSILGERRIILSDTKAVAHFHTKDTWTYVRPPAVKKMVENGFGRGLIWADGESHKRQRKSLNPAFSVVSIRKLTPIFYDSVHKAKGAWNALLETSSENSVVIDVESWMNHISFDTIGLAGFSHDFGSLDGKHVSIAEIFESLSSTPISTLNLAIALLAQTIPLFVNLPTKHSKLLWKMNTAMEEILDILLARAKKDMDTSVDVDKEERSIIGLLIKGESADSGFRLSREEVLSQMKILLLAGYETTSISLTWALIELSRNPEIQTKLRNELVEHGSDPTYDQLANGLPYLDAVVHEILRLHAPASETIRMAGEDDIIPLSEPVRTRSGQLVDSLSIAAGTSIVIPMASINVSSAVWGEDAKMFKPSRWLEDSHGQSAIPAKAREVIGYRHLLTFSDGPRTCIGKTFAVAEFKAVLCVLIKNFVFELRDGPETKIVGGRGSFPRPKVTAEDGSRCKVPFRVKSYIS